MPANPPPPADHGQGAAGVALMGLLFLLGLLMLALPTVIKMLRWTARIITCTADYLEDRPTASSAGIEKAAAAEAGELVA